LGNNTEGPEDIDADTGEDHLKRIAEIPAK
jgi:hypothetical protein